MLNSFVELLNSVSLVHFSDYGLYQVSSSLCPNHFQKNPQIFFSVLSKLVALIAFTLFIVGLSELDFWGWKECLKLW